MESLQLTAVGSVSYLLPLLCNFCFYSFCFFWLFFFAFALQTCSFLIVTFFFCPVSFPPTNKTNDIYLLVDYWIPLQCTKHVALKQLSRLKNDKPFPCTFTYAHCLLFSPSSFPKWHSKNLLQFSLHFWSEGIIISFAATVTQTNLNQIKHYCL